MSDSATESRSRDRYVVVARRYRPQTFGQLVGQKPVAQALSNAIQTGRVGHAYLFTGARGVGKTSTARIFAKCLNAPGGPSVEFDNSTDISRAIDAGEDVDVLEIDGASNRGIDEIRQLRAGVGMRPSRSRYKIYIIDEVHMLTQAAFNALLKTLEEPPEHVKFIFCTTDPEKIPITVLSRCQRFDFAPVDTEEILGRLREIATAEGAEAEEEALRQIARRAGGSLRDSQSLLEQVLSFAGGKVTVDHIHQMLGTANDAVLVALASRLSGRDAAGALAAIDDAVTAGADCGQLAEQLLGYFRDSLAAAVGGPPEIMRYGNLHAEGFEAFAAQGRELGVATLLAIVQLIDQAIVRMRQSMHGRVLLEAAAVQICHLPDLQRLADVAAGLGGAAGGDGKDAAAGQKKNELAEPGAESPVASAGASEDAPPAARAPARSGARSPSPQAPVPAGQVSLDEADEADEAAGRPPDRAAAAESASGTAVAVEDAASPAPANPAPAAPVPIELNEQSAGRVWAQAVNALDDLTADFAKKAAKIELEGADTLCVHFPASCELAFNQCQSQERKRAIERMVSDISERDVHIVFSLLSPPAASAASPKTPAAVGRVQRRREAERDPFVQQVVDLFDGEIVKVDGPR